MKKILLSILCLFSIFAVRAEEVTVTFSELGFENGAAVESYEFDENITATFDKGTNQNAPKYYNTGAALRIYGGGTMTIAAAEGVTINSVSFTIHVDSKKATNGSVNAESSVSAGTLTIGDASTPTTITDINASEVVFTQGGTSGHVRIVTLTVDYTPAVAAAVAKPTASVANGAILYNITNVELSGEGTIHYTTDGTEPTAESAVYSEAIAINEFGKTTTIKAIAINGEESSEVATFNYDLKVAAPVFSVKGGISTKINGLTFTCETEGATIFYNNRGKDPITEGSKPWGALSVLASSTINAVAYVTNDAGEKIYSEISSEEYIITSTQPFKAASAIESGKKYLVVYDGNALIPHETSKNYGYMSGKKVDVNGQFIETFEYYGFTITETATAGEYVIMGGDKRYLYTAFDNKNNTWYKSFNVASDTTGIGDAAIWTISINDEGAATITNKVSGFTVQYSSYKNFETNSNATALPTLYELTQYPTITFTPANYETVETISQVVVTCEEGIALNESDELYATYQDDNYQTIDLGNGKVSEDGKSVIYDLSTPIDKNGYYYFNFPKGLFTMNPDGLAKLSDDESLSIAVENMNNLEVVYSNPMNNKTVESIAELYIEFNQDIVWADSLNEAVIVDDKGNEYALTNTSTDSWGDPVPSTALNLTVSEPITAAGTYTFVLKKDYVYASANANIKMTEDVTYTFTINEALKLTTFNTVKDETGAITELYMEFNQDVACYAEAFYVLGPEEAEYFFVPTYEDADGNELPWNTVRAIATEPINLAGTYNVYVTNVYPAGDQGMMGMGGINEMRTIVFEGSTTGINDTIAEGNDKVVIYDLTGRRVNNINKAGIYIVNGVKTVVE